MQLISLSFSFRKPGPLGAIENKERSLEAALNRNKIIFARGKDRWVYYTAIEQVNETVQEYLLEKWEQDALKPNRIFEKNR